MKHTLFTVFGKWLLLLPFVFCSLLQIQAVQTPSADSTIMSHHDQLDVDVDVNVLVCDVDTIKDDLSNIYDEMKTLTNDVKSYVNDDSECCCWNKIGAIGSIVGVCVMIFVYCRSRKQTNDQIVNQSDNTNKQIEEQRRSSSEQIKAMQDQALLRTRSLEQMGKIIEKHTGEIQASVKHFENRYLDSNDEANALNALSEMKKIYNLMCDTLNNDYEHFDNESKSKETNYGFYKDSSSKIKGYTETLRGILIKHRSSHQIPDEKPYLDALAAVVFKPNLLEMYEQKEEFKQKGAAYHNDVEFVISSLFND